MRIEPRPALDPELSALVTAQQQAVGGPGFTPDDDAAYLVAVVDMRAVACGAWQALPEPDAAELLRMYVRPAFRGRGIARQLIVAIEEEALAAGRPVVRVAAGSSPAAIALFQSSGYHEFTGPAGIRFEKRLVALAR